MVLTFFRISITVLFLYDFNYFILISVSFSKSFFNDFLLVLVPQLSVQFQSRQHLYCTFKSKFDLIIIFYSSF